MDKAFIPHGGICAHHGSFLLSPVWLAYPPAFVVVIFVFITGFGLRALLQELCHLSHVSSLFCFSLVFRDSLSLLPGADCGPSVSSSCVARIMDMTL
jgi:hypothetical protein